MNASLFNQTAFDSGQGAVISKAEPRDAARLTSLIQNHYNWINVYNSPFSVVQRKTSEKSMLDAISTYPSVVARVDDLVVGFAITFPQEPSLMQLRLMYVDDSYRNRGIATSMLPRLEEQILSAGYGTVMATSSTLWYPNKRLPTHIFERCNYTVTRIGADTELYTHELGPAQPGIQTTDPDQLAGIRSIGFPGSY